jgi:hypothetical protein
MTIDILAATGAVLLLIGFVGLLYGVTVRRRSFALLSVAALVAGIGLSVAWTIMPPDETRHAWWVIVIGE